MSRRIWVSTNRGEGETWVIEKYANKAGATFGSSLRCPACGKHAIAVHNRERRSLFSRVWIGSRLMSIPIHLKMCRVVCTTSELRFGPTASRGWYPVCGLHVHRSRRYTRCILRIYISYVISHLVQALIFTVTEVLPPLACQLWG